MYVSVVFELMFVHELEYHLESIPNLQRDINTNIQKQLKRCSRGSMDDGGGINFCMVDLLFYQFLGSIIDN